MRDQDEFFADFQRDHGLDARGFMVKGGCLVLALNALWLLFVVGVILAAIYGVVHYIL